MGGGAREGQGSKRRVEKQGEVGGGARGEGWRSKERWEEEQGDRWMQGRLREKTIVLPRVRPTLSPSATKKEAKKTDRPKGLQ